MTPPMGIQTKASFPALSFNQEFLCALNHGEEAGSFSQWYTIPHGLRLRGAVDAGALGAALDDVVARHQILRTSLRHDAQGWLQEIHPPSPVSLRVEDLTSARSGSADCLAYDLLDEVEAEPFSPRDVPLLRAVLGRLGQDDHVIVLMTHHIASDAWSMQVLIRDLAACYAARAGRRRPDLPDACQYREFAAWQRLRAQSWAQVASGYWREKLLRAQVLAVPADRALPDGAADPYSVHRFVIGQELAGATARVARSAKSSLFVALLAAYNLLASQRTGATDLVVPTFTSGRGEPRFAEVVGPLYNFLPIRTDIGGSASFLDVIARTRASCLEAYANDIPFTLIEAQAGDLMLPCADENRAVAAFEMLPPPALADVERAGDISYAELRDRLASRPVGASTPKGMLWALDRLRSGEIVGTVRFSRDRFDEGTIADFVTQYRHVLAASVAEPTARLDRQ